MSCRCEPHASGSNRCEECRYEMQTGKMRRADQDVGVANALRAAVEFICALANTAGDAPTTRARAAEWLDANGFDGPRKARRAAEKRKAELTKQIQDCQTELSKLDSDLQAGL